MIPEDLRRELAGLNLQVRLLQGNIYVKDAIYSTSKYWTLAMHSVYATGDRRRQ